MVLSLQVVLRVGKFFLVLKLTISMAIRNLKVLLISDDRPGHYHLSDGIAAAAQRIRPVEVTRLTIERRWSPTALSLLCRAGVPPGLVLRVGYGLEPSNLPVADVIVSAGAETLGANVAAARLLGIPNIFYGSLRWYPAESFSLVLTSYPESAARPRHVMVMKPSRPISATLADAGEPGLVHQPSVGGLLIGGPARGFEYGAEDWETLLSFLDEAYRVLGTRWAISNSRRTPDIISEAVRAKARAADGVIADFVDVRHVGNGTLSCVFNQVQFILCTDDSSTMVSESIAARRPVVGLRPSKCAFRPDEAEYRRYLSEQGWYKPIAIAELTPANLIQVVAKIRPSQDDPMDHLATILREYLPNLFRI